MLAYLGYALAERLAGAFAARMSGEMLDSLAKGDQSNFTTALILMLGVQFAYAVLFVLMEVPYSIVSNLRTEHRAGGLSLRGLRLSLPQDRRLLVRGLELSLEAGHSLLIEGASGCGKSTLVRAVAGLWESGQGRSNGLLSSR